MRPLYLRAPLVGVALIPAAFVAFVVLTLLALFSRRAEDGFERMFGKEEDEGVMQGPVRMLVITDGTVGEEEEEVEEIGTTVLAGDVEHD